MAERMGDRGSWRASGSGALSCSRSWHRETAAIVFARFFWLEIWRPMGLTDRRERSSWRGKTLAFCGFAMALSGLIPMAAPMPARAVELSAPVAALYSTVSIFPPSAKSMTVCYGFVCRRREVLDFTPGDRNALTQILAAGRASPAARPAAVEKAGGWVAGPRGRGVWTNKKAAKRGFRGFRGEQK